jgi:hypothetical protein
LAVSLELPEVNGLNGVEAIVFLPAPLAQPTLEEPA